MSVSIFTTELQISIMDPDTGEWGGYTDGKNMLNITAAKPEPTVIKDISSRPDDTFSSTLESAVIGSGSPTLTISTRDVVNRTTAPVEVTMLAAALAAKVTSGTLQAAATNHGFSATIDRLGANFDTGKRNLNASATVVHKRAELDGLMAGQVASATTTTLVVTGAGWTVDALIGKKVMIASGTGAGQVVAITDNAAAEVTVASWTTQPDNTSAFRIVEATALTRGTDYSVDADYGTVKPLTTGSLVATDIIDGFVTAFSITGTKLRGATVNSITFRGRGKSKDMKTGEVGFLEIHSVTAYPTENVEFVANAESPAFTQLTLTGEMEIPDGFTEPYTFTVGEVRATS